MVGIKNVALLATLPLVATADLAGEDATGANNLRAGNMEQDEQHHRELFWGALGRAAVKGGKALAEGGASGTGTAAGAATGAAAGTAISRATDDDDDDSGGSSGGGGGCTIM